MNYFRLFLLLACFVSVVCIIVGCSNNSSNQPAAMVYDRSHPDTMAVFALKSPGDGEYLMLACPDDDMNMETICSHPDTMGYFHLVLKGPVPPPIAPTPNLAKPGAKTAMARHEEMLKPLPWPPDTMRLIFKGLRAGLRKMK